MGEETESLRRLASAGVRHWLLGLVEALLADAGGLYNPVFVGPLIDPAPLVDGVSEALAARLSTVCRGSEPPAGGIWLLPADRAEEALAAGWAPRPGVQWIVWGAGAVSTLPDRLAGWIGARGLAVDPLVGAAESTAAWSMGPSVAAAHAEGVERGERAFVMVSGESSDLPALAAELQLHLELELATAVWRGRAEGWNEGDSATDPRVLVVPAEVDAVAFCRRLTELGPGALWGLVMESEVAERIRTEASVALAGRVWWVRRGASSFSGAGAFPPIVELLIGHQCVQPLREEIMQFSLGAVSLLEILQAAEGWVRSGVLVAFDLDRCGWIRVGNSRVSGAGLLGGGDEARSERAVYDVLAVIAAWTSATIVFIPGPAGEHGVPLGRAVMAVAHSVGDQAAPAASSVRRLRVAEVGRALVEWGVPDVARGFLQRAEQALAWGPEEDVLLGNLSADHSPDAAATRLRHGAMRAFAEGGNAGSVSLYFDAMLNALLVEVRAGHTPPSVGWSIVGGWLRDAGIEWVTTARHAAIWMELALRAGANESAVRAQQHLRSLAPASCPGLGALLDLQVAGGVDAR